MRKDAYEKATQLARRIRALEDSAESLEKGGGLCITAGGPFNASIPLSEAMAAQLRELVAADVQAQLRAAEAEFADL